jgi:hypothetical protein
MFCTQLHNISMLLTPIARGLQTLEGQNTMCSDVFHIFVGIAIGFTNVFLDTSTLGSFPSHLLANGLDAP